MRKNGYYFAKCKSCTIERYEKGQVLKKGEMLIALINKK